MMQADDESKQMAMQADPDFAHCVSCQQQWTSCGRGLSDGRLQQHQVETADVSDKDDAEDDAALDALSEPTGGAVQFSTYVHSPKMLMALCNQPYTDGHAHLDLTPSSGTYLRRSCSDRLILTRWARHIGSTEAGRCTGAVAPLCSVLHPTDAQVLPAHPILPMPNLCLPWCLPLPLRLPPSASAKVHRFHHETLSMGLVSDDFRQFTKQAYDTHGCPIA